MNERIKELAHQADLVIKKSNGNDFRFGEMDPKLEKFAELIIRECGEWVSDNVADGFCEGPRLLKHFGIEE